MNKIKEKLTVPVIKGDGVGPEICEVAIAVTAAAVEAAYGDEREIVWLEKYAGQSAFEEFGEWLPNETLHAIKNYGVALKGPLTTPVGEGIRSLNVKIRQSLDLYACVRPCRWIRGAPSPVRRPEDLDVVIFRENTEDVYAGIEWREGSLDCKKLIDLLKSQFNISVREDAGLGLKLISKRGTERIVRAAIKWAIKEKRRSVTLVHKGNIMKYTEGAFVNWGYELAEREFQDSVVKEADLKKLTSEEMKDKIIIKDRIADSMFQQVLLKPREYDIIVTTNLNGDYLSDACAAQIGGIGMAPSANINFENGLAVFEPVHGTAPKYAGLDIANPTGMILSCWMLLNYVGWSEAADAIWKSLENCISSNLVTMDLAKQKGIDNYLKCSEFGRAVIKSIKNHAATEKI